VAIVTTFSFLRLSRDCCWFDCRDYFYAPRLGQRSQLPATLDSLWKWLPAVLKIDYDEAYELLGMDATMYLRMLALGAKFFTLASLWGLIVLLPVYGTGEQQTVDTIENDSPEVRVRGNDISKYSMSNLVADDSKLFLSVFSAWLLAGVLFAFLRWEWLAYLDLRQKFLSEPSPAQYTIMVRDIPGHLRTDEALAKEFLDVFGNKVFQATVNADLADLDKLVERREDTCAELERYMVKEDRRERKREDSPDDAADTQVPQVTLGGFCGTGICGDKVDAVPYLENLLGTLNQQVKADVEQWGGIKNIQQEKMQDTIAKQKRRESNASSSHGGTNSFVWQETVNLPVNNASDKASTPLEKQGSNENTSRLNDEPLTTPLLGEGEKRTSIGGVFYGTATKIKNVQQFTAAAGYQAVGVLANVMVGSKVFGSTGFVTFNSLRARTVAQQAQLRDKPFTMYIENAPYPDDVDWARIGMPHYERTIRAAIVSASAFFLIIAYLPLVIFNAALANIEEIERQFPWVEDLLQDNDFLRAVLSGLLPQAGVLILIVTLPPIFKLLARWEGTHAESLQYLRSFDLLYTFLLFQILLIVSLASSVITTVDLILNQPREILNLLAGSNGGGLPGASSYYISFVILNAFVYVPLELLQLSAWLCYPFTKCCCAPSKTARDIAKLKATGTFMYDSATARWLVIFVIGLTYAVIAPLLLPFCAMYFGIAYITYAYVLFYVYEKDFQAGGILWPMVFSRICYGLLIAQLTLLGLIIIKQAFVAAAFLLPLPGLTILFRTFCMEQYYPLSVTLSMQTALDVDNKHKQKNADGTVSDTPFLTEFQYLQPSLLHQTTLPLEPKPYAWIDPREELTSGPDGDDPKTSCFTEEGGSNSFRPKNPRYQDGSSIIQENSKDSRSTPPPLLSSSSPPPSSSSAHIACRLFLFILPPLIHAHNRHYCASSLLPIITIRLPFLRVLKGFRPSVPSRHCHHHHHHYHHHHHHHHHHDQSPREL
jgi:hypothetical protein